MEVWNEGLAEIEQIAGRLEWLDPMPREEEKSSEGPEAPGANFDLATWQRNNAQFGPVVFLFFTWTHWLFICLNNLTAKSVECLFVALLVATLWVHLGLGESFTSKMVRFGDPSMPCSRCRGVQ